MTGVQTCALPILTSMPIAILVQFVWWFIDTSLTALSGDTKIFTLMIRHNLLRGSELIKQDFNLICLNRGLFVILSLILIALSVVVYNKKRGGKLNYPRLFTAMPCEVAESHMITVF